MKTILIAEDDPILIDWYTKKLQAVEDYKLLFAEDGEKAIEMLDNIQPDLLLLNIHMPKASGLDVLKYIQKRKGYDFPILIVTNQQRKEFVDKALELGATEYLIKKDLTIEKLKLVIQKYLL